MFIIVLQTNKKKKRNKIKYESIKTKLIYEFKTDLIFFTEIVFISFTKYDLYFP